MTWEMLLVELQAVLPDMVESAHIFITISWAVPLPHVSKPSTQRTKRSSRLLDHQENTAGLLVTPQADNYIWQKAPYMHNDARNGLPSRKDCAATEEVWG